MKKMGDEGLTELVAGDALRICVVMSCLVSFPTQDPKFVITKYQLPLALAM
jgi:hypothetical protein